MAKKRWVAEAAVIEYDQITDITADTEEQAVAKARLQFEEENPGATITEIQVWEDAEW